MCDPEIRRLSVIFSANAKVQELANGYLRKLNRATNNSMGKADMLKYLACIDLAHRYYSIPLNSQIGNKYGLKSPMYPNVIRNIIKLVQINKQVSFDELAQKFGCNHIKSRIQQTFEKYYSKKMASLPPVQRRHIDLGSSVYRAACFKVASKKYSKIKVDIDKLCLIMCVEKKKLDIVIQDVENLCFAKKRTFDQFNNQTSKLSNNNEMKNNETNDMNEDSMFQDGYQTRKQRKHEQWKRKQLSMATKIDNIGNKQNKPNKPNKPNKTKKPNNQSKVSKENNKNTNFNIIEQISASNNESEMKSVETDILQATHESNSPVNQPINEPINKPIDQSINKSKSPSHPKPSSIKTMQSSTNKNKKQVNLVSMFKKMSDHK